MNKRVKMLGILIATILIAVSALAQTVEWKVSELDDNSNFSKQYSYKTCSISVRTDGQGVTISSLDPNWYSKQLIQHIEIKKNKYGGASKKEDFMVSYAQSGLAYFERTTGYDIFYVKYREAAKKLPPEAKKAFLGFYGLE